MKRKRLITTGVMALILTIGTGQAFGAILEATTAAQEAVTEVQKKVIVSGPVQTPLISAGPVLKSEPPLVGSYDWLAQEKAERDRLESAAAQTQAELEAEIARLEKIANDTKTLNETLVLVKNQIGITRWVLGGDRKSVV
jgi:hypothetical protein